MSETENRNLLRKTEKPETPVATQKDEAQSASSATQTQTGTAKRKVDKVAKKKDKKKKKKGSKKSKKWHKAQNSSAAARYVLSFGFGLRCWLNVSVSARSVFSPLFFISISKCSRNCAPFFLCMLSSRCVLWLTAFKQSWSTSCTTLRAIVPQPWRRKICTHRMH